MRTFLLVFALLFSGTVEANSLKKLFTVDWMKDKALKYGYVSSVCLAQSATGITEGYHFGGHSGYLCKEKNYHTYATVRRVGWISTGWLAQANVRTKRLTWTQKLRRLVGGAMIARNCFEWSYKWQRYNNPFDYTKEHNEHALVYFKFSGGQFTDAYIGTGQVTGPLVDILFLFFGVVLFE